MTIIDSYDESNYSIYLACYYGDTIYVGQSFQNIYASILDSCKFYLKKVGNPTGNVYAKLYAHTGEYGVNGKPTGSALAVSDALDVSTLADSFQLTTFNFSGANRINLSADTYYCIEFYYSGSSVFPDNYIQIGGDHTSPNHSGNINYSFNGNSWNTDISPIIDIIFYVYKALQIGYVGFCEAS